MRVHVQRPRRQRSDARAGELLRSRGVLDNGLGNGVEEFTLLPGTVERIDRVARRRVLLIGSLVDESGELLGDASIELSGNPALIDSSSVFQAEVVVEAELTVRREDGRRCAFIAPDVPDGEEVLILDAPIVCRATTRAAADDQ